MAHWFHRNPLKATVPQTFDSLRAAAKTSDANKTLTYVAIRFVAVLPWTSLHMFLPLSCQQWLETVQGKAVDFAEKSREICGRSVGRSGALLVTFTRINRASCRSDGNAQTPSGGRGRKCKCCANTEWRKQTAKVSSLQMDWHFTWERGQVCFIKV